MPETAWDIEYMSDGRGGSVEVRRTPRIVSDDEIKRRDAPPRLRAAYAALNAWVADARTAATAEQATSDGWATATAGQKDAANKALHTRMAVTFDRLAIFFDRFADLLIQQGLDQ